MFDWWRSSQPQLWLRTVPTNARDVALPVETGWTVRRPQASSAEAIIANRCRPNHTGRKQGEFRFSDALDGSSEDPLKQPEGGAFGSARFIANQPNPPRSCRLPVKIWVGFVEVGTYSVLNDRVNWAAPLRM
jgi:hypothetical protein